MAATAASTSRRTLRPTTAAICATSLATPERSSRAISDSCNEAGIACSEISNSALSDPASAPRQQHGAADLLDEQRHAVGLARDQPCQRGRDGAAAEQALHHHVDITRRQRLQLQHHGVAPARPRRVEPIACGQHQQQLGFRRCRRSAGRAARARSDRANAGPRPPGTAACVAAIRRKLVVQDREQALAQHRRRQRRGRLFGFNAQQLLHQWQLLRESRPAADQERRPASPVASPAAPTYRSAPIAVAEQ